MEYTALGQTGVIVSRLCLGVMSFGGTADAEESSRMYLSAREAGINFFDCANVYNGGRSEEILGGLIKSHRDEVIITSKFTFRSNPGVNGLGSSRLNAVREVEKSLKRLNTDRIDLYFIHSFDQLTAIEETLRALDDLVRSGKILYIGASNWAAWQISKALGISARYGWNRIACIQPMYSLIKRQAESELLPMAISENIGVITYSPLAGGVLVRDYKHGEIPARGRLAEVDRYRLRYDRMEFYRAAESFRNLAAERGIKPATLGVAWVASRRGVTAPIIGARNNTQLLDSLAAAELPCDEELMKQVTDLFPGPPPATDRLEEQIEGYGLRGG